MFSAPLLPSRGGCTPASTEQGRPRVRVWGRELWGVLRVQEVWACTPVVRMGGVFVSSNCRQPAATKGSLM